MEGDEELSDLRQKVRDLEVAANVHELALAAQAKAIFDLQAQVVRLMGEMLHALEQHPESRAHAGRHG